MHIVQATQKVKSVLDLPVLKVQFNKNEKKFFNDTDFWSADLQTAIRMGYLKVEGGVVLQTQGTARVMKCKNIYHRAVAITSLNTSVKPGQIFHLSEDQLNTDEMRKALAANIIQTLGIVGGSNDTGDEGYVSLTKPQTPTDSGSVALEEPKPEAKKSKGKGKKAIQEAEGSVKVSEIIELETNSEMATPRRVIESDNPDPVTKEEINDPKKGSVIWNPTNSPISNTMQNVSVQEEMKESEPEPDPRKASMVWDFAKKEVKIVENKQEVKPLGFVDQEQQEIRSKSHPKLQNKPAPQNSEIKFVE